MTILVRAYILEAETTLEESEKQAQELANKLGVGIAWKFQGEKKVTLPNSNELHNNF